MSGYCNCACRDCFEIAISSDDKPALCWECEESGCSAEGDSECDREPEQSCPHCGSEDLQGTPISLNCAECGYQVA